MNMESRGHMAKLTTVRLTLTAADIAAAQGGVDPLDDRTPIWVEIPSDYDAAAITADDVVRDPAITVVGDPEDDE
jgi:hypothetical protein